MSTVPHASSWINAKSGRAHSSPTDLKDAWLRANHVASHAVSAHILGVARDDLRTIALTAPYERGTDDLRLLASSRWTDVRRGGLVRLAGDIGEHVTTSNDDIDIYVVGDEIVWPDRWPRTTCAYFVTNALRRVAGAELRRWLPEIVSDTLKLVRANKTIIARVAIELFQHGVIDGDRLRDMIDHAAVVPDDLVLGGGRYVD